MSEYTLQLERYDESDRIKKLGMVMPFSNTERSSFGCPRLWTLDYVQNYKTEEKSDALMYGVIWHCLLEKILLDVKQTDKLINCNDVAAFLNEHLTPTIENCYLSSGDASFLEEAMSFGKIEEIEQRVINALPGWVLSWQEVIKRFKVLEVELTLAAPVVDYNGEIKKFPVYVVEDGDTVRPARIGEGNKDNRKEIPYYKIGKIDCLLEERTTGDLWICDHKTSSSPSSYENSLTYDLQLPSYASLLDYEINDGELQQYKGKEITGVMYDICHSKISSIPKLLKSGKLSTAKNAGITSWIFEDAIEHYGLGKSQYKDHIEYLKNNVDTKKFMQRYYYVNEQDIERCASEDFGVASAMNRKRSQLAMTEEDSKLEFDEIAYRYPVCQKYGNCKFSSICLADNHPSVIMDHKSDKINWLRNKPQN